MSTTVRQWGRGSCTWMLRGLPKGPSREEVMAVMGLGVGFEYGDAKWTY